MKHLFVLSTLFLFVALNPIQAQQVEHTIDKQLEACLSTDDGSTTVGMMECEMTAQKAWDKELNKNYQLLMGELDAGEKKQLKLAQRQWIKFRDLEFEFSGNMHYNMEGTMYRVMAAGRQTVFIRQRALALQQYYSNKTGN